MKILSTFLLAAAVIAVDGCININEDYSLKNIEGSSSVLPGITSNREVTYTIPVNDFLSRDMESDSLRVDSNGDYRVVARANGYPGEVASCSFSDESFNEWSNSVTLWDASMVYMMDKLALVPFYSNGVTLHTPIELEVGNPDGVEGELSVVLSSGWGGELHFDGMPLESGMNHYILDSEELMEYMTSHWRSLQYLTFSYYKNERKLPKSICTISVKASIPVEIMPGQKFTHRYDSFLFDNLRLYEDYPGMRNSHVLFTTGMTFENTIPADFTLKSAKDESGWFIGSIDGLGTIPAGSLSSPGVTEMTWTVESMEGMGCAIPFDVEVSIPGDKPVRLNAGQKLSVYSNYVKFENGI